MPCFRYVTPVLKGRWFQSEVEALEAALLAGQAFMSGGEILLFDFVRLESHSEDLCSEECSTLRKRPTR